MVNIDLKKIASIVNRLPMPQKIRDQILEMYATRLNNYYNLKFQAPKFNKSKVIKLMKP